MKTCGTVRVGSSAEQCAGAGEGTPQHAVHTIAIGAHDL